MAQILAGQWFTNGSRSTNTRLADQLAPLLWPIDQAHMALRAVVLHQGWVSETTLPAVLPLRNGYTFDQWLPYSAEQMNVDLEAIVTDYAQIDTFLRASGPALLRVKVEDTEGVLVVVRNGARRVTVLDANTLPRRIPTQLLRAALCHQHEAIWHDEIEATLTTLGITTPRERSQMRQALLDKQLGDVTLDNLWLINLSPGADLVTLVRYARLPWLLAWITLTQLVLNATNYAGIAVIGVAALNARVQWSFILGGLLLLQFRIPLLAILSWLNAVYSYELGVTIKARLLYGVLRLHPTEVETIGTGQFLFWGMEAEALSNLSGSLINSLRSLSAVLVVLITMVIAVGNVVALYFVGWFIFLGVSIWLIQRMHYRYRLYFATMTNGMLERMQGHQTRLVQETDWFARDDEAFSQYIEYASRHDRYRTFFLALMPISWMLVSIAAIAKLFVTDPNNPLVEVGFAVVLLASLEVSELARSLEQLIKAISSWRLIRPIEQGAKRPDEDQPQEQGVTVVRPVDAEAGRLLLNGYGLNFRYPGRDRAILDRVSLKLHVGERILLEGPSGGGKSTFASLLTGYLTPQSGLLFLWGLDKSIVGTDRWRQWVVYVPQFHQNHIISGTLAFNLLMGRRWPPSPTDLEDAETILSELGMGELLEKMPLGLQQRVGERGWYLSHGERSRLYIARALLQQADLIILDESFASLDPENMAIALRTVLKRAKTLMVIAHP